MKAKSISIYFSKCIFMYITMLFTIYFFTGCERLDKPNVKDSKIYGKINIIGFDNTDDINIELVDELENIKYKQHPGVDGYYSFDNLQGGNYSLKISYMDGLEEFSFPKIKRGEIKKIRDINIIFFSNIEDVKIEIGGYKTLTQKNQNSEETLFLEPEKSIRYSVKVLYKQNNTLLESDITSILEDTSGLYMKNLQKGIDLSIDKTNAIQLKNGNINTLNSDITDVVKLYCKFGNKTITQKIRVSSIDNSKLNQIENITYFSDKLYSDDNTYLQTEIGKICYISVFALMRDANNVFLKDVTDICNPYEDNYQNNDNYLIGRDPFVNRVIIQPKTAGKITLPMICKSRIFNLNILCSSNNYITIAQDFLSNYVSSVSLTGTFYQNTLSNPYKDDTNMDFSDNIFLKDVTIKNSGYYYYRFTGILSNGKETVYGYDLENDEMLSSEKNNFCRYFDAGVYSIRIHLKERSISYEKKSDLVYKNGEIKFVNIYSAEGKLYLQPYDINSSTITVYTYDNINSAIIDVSVKDATILSGNGVHEIVPGKNIFELKIQTLDNNMLTKYIVIRKNCSWNSFFTQTFKSHSWINGSKYLYFAPLNSCLITDTNNSTYSYSLDKSKVPEKNNDGVDSRAYFSSDGILCASVYSSGKIYITDNSKYTINKHFTINDFSNVLEATFAFSNNKKNFYAFKDSLYIYDLESCKLTNKLSLNIGKIDSVIATIQGLIILSETGNNSQISFFDASTNKISSVLLNMSNVVIEYNESKSQILINDSSGKFTLYSYPEMKKLTEFDSKINQNAEAFTFISSKNAILYGKENKLHLYSLSEQKEVFSLDINIGIIKNISKSTDSNFICLGTLGYAKLESSETSLELTLSENTTCHYEPISSLSISPTNNVLWSASKTGAVLKWSLSDKANITLPVNTLNGLSSFYFYTDSDKALTGDLNGLVQEVTFSEKLSLKKIIKESDKVISILESADSKKLVLTLANSTINVWNKNSGIKLYSMPSKNSGKVVSSAISKLNRIATADATGELLIQDIDTKKLLCRTKLHLSTISAIVFSPDGQTIVTAGVDTYIKVFNINTGAIVKSFKLNSPVNALALKENGKVLISGDNDGNIDVREIDTGELLNTFIGHCNAVTAVTASDDGKRIIYGGADGTVNFLETY